MRWVAVCMLTELDAAERLERIVEGQALLLIRRCSDQPPWACSATCPHAFAPLISGEVRAGRLHCARHLASFDLSTGSPDESWRIPPLRIFPTRIRNNVIEIGLPAAAS